MFPILKKMPKPGNSTFVIDINLRVFSSQPISRKPEQQKKAGKVTEDDGPEGEPVETRKSNLTVMENKMNIINLKMLIKNLAREDTTLPFPLKELVNL